MSRFLFSGLLVLVCACPAFAQPMLIPSGPVEVVAPHPSEAPSRNAPGDALPVVPHLQPSPPATTVLPTPDRPTIVLPGPDQHSTPPSPPPHVHAAPPLFQAAPQMTSGRPCPCEQGISNSRSASSPAGWGSAIPPTYRGGAGVGGLHMRYPYYSYRHSWYTPGPAGANVTIVW